MFCPLHFTISLPDLLSWTTPYKFMLYIFHGIVCGVETHACCVQLCAGIWAPSQYPKRRLSVRSRKVSKPRDLYLELSDRYEIWQAPRQQCCRCACQISKRYDNLKYQSRGFETLRDLMERRLFGYWDGAQDICFNWRRNVWLGAHLNLNPLTHWQQSPGAQLIYCRGD